MRITQETINSVQNRTNIGEVIGEFITLKKRGQNLWAPCPFHHEKTPSFSVSPSKGFYKCFGCSAKGDAITFLRELEGMSFTEAIIFLANKYGITVETDGSDVPLDNEKNEKDSLYIIYELAKNYFINNLFESEEGQNIGLTYLNHRGILPASIKKFELGYSIKSWDNFILHAKSQGYDEEQLRKSGLIIHKEGSRDYDRFRSRLIFPIHNIYGKIVALAGRLLEDIKDSPKYINSPESIIYHKGDILYGIFHAKQKIKDENVCYIVEGYTDVISLNISGIENVVASGGTSLTENQIRLINRFTSNIIILFDGDKAGVSASLRSIDMILEQGMNVKVAALPEGEDPDSYIKKVGSQEFKRYLNSNIQDFVTFKAHLLNNDCKDDPIKRSEIIKDIVRSIAAIPDIIKRSLFIQSCSKVLKIDEEVLIAELNRLIDFKKGNRRNLNQNYSGVAPVSGIKQQVGDGIEVCEKELLSMFLKYGKEKLNEEQALENYILKELEDVEFITPKFKEILKIIKEKNISGEKIGANFFISHENEKIKTTVIDLIAEPYEISSNWEERAGIYINKESDNLQKSAYKNILRLKLKLLKKLIKENQMLFKEVDSEEKSEELLMIHNHLKKSEKQITDTLGIVMMGR